MTTDSWGHAATLADMALLDKRAGLRATWLLALVGAATVLFIAFMP